LGRELPIAITFTPINIGAPKITAISTPDVTTKRADIIIPNKLIANKPTISLGRSFLIAAGLPFTFTVGALFFA
jgi:hypothetical protein